MTDQNIANDNGSQTKGEKGYNLNVTVIGSIDTTPAANDTKKIKFRGSYEAQGQTRERTFVAMGKAADAIDGKVVEGQVVAIRGIFKNAPGEGGKRGGQFVSVIGEPLPPKKKAA